MWSKNNLTGNTKIQVYRACILIALLCSSEGWATYAAQERRLNSFHLCCLQHILGIRWQERIPYTQVLQRAQVPSIFALLTQSPLRWLGHVHCMDDGRIPTKTCSTVSLPMVPELEVIPPFATKTHASVT